MNCYFFLSSLRSISIQDCKRLFNVKERKDNSGKCKFCLNKPQIGENIKINIIKEQFYSKRKNLITTKKVEKRRKSKAIRSIASIAYYKKKKK